MTQMTTDQILARLAQITGKNNERPIEEPMRGNIIRDISEDDSGDRIESTVESVVSSDAIEKQPIGDIEPIRSWPESLNTLANLWGATISENGTLIGFTKTMSKKDYQKYIKGKTQEDIFTDPLRYVLFRSEEQSDVNYFNWLDRFPKEKDEGK
jgi:hypothetical protein